MFEKFVKVIHNPILFRLFLITKLPSAYFCGVRVKYIDKEKCTATVPYKWFSKNPFRSTYFACLSMAAEMSTGVLAMGHTYQLDPPVSMLVTKVSGEFFKKATGITGFTCSDGENLRSIIQEAINTGESATFIASSIGKNKDGEIIAEFHITWSFKVRSSSRIISEIT